MTKFTIWRNPAPSRGAGPVLPITPREQAELDELRRRGAFDRYYGRK